MTIDIVRPLKYETPDSCGTQIDFLPTEVNPNEDYIAAKGLVLGVSACGVSGNRIEDVSGVAFFYDDENPVSGWTLSDLARRLYGRPVADIHPEETDLLAWDSVSGWYPKSQGTVSIASPGLTWGRSGNLPVSTYLLNDGVPSSTAGRIVPLDGRVVEMFVACETATTATITFQKRNGSTFTDFLSINLVAERKKRISVSLDNDITKSDELACYISSGSVKNCVAGLIAIGTA